MQLKYSTSEQGNALNLFWGNCWSFPLSFWLFHEIVPLPFWKHHSLTWYISVTLKLAKKYFKALSIMLHTIKYWYICIMISSTPWKPGLKKVVKEPLLHLLTKMRSSMKRTNTSSKSYCILIHYIEYSNVLYFLGTYRKTIF